MAAPIRPIDVGNGRDGKPRLSWRRYYLCLWLSTGNFLFRTPVRGCQLRSSIPLVFRLATCVSDFVSNSSLPYLPRLFSKRQPHANTTAVQPHRTASCFDSKRFHDSVAIGPRVYRTQALYILPGCMLDITTNYRVLSRLT